MIGLWDPVLALDFDLAAAARLLEFERLAAGVYASDDEGIIAAHQRIRQVQW